MTADNLKDDRYDESTDGELSHGEKIPHQMTQIFKTFETHSKYDFGRYYLTFTSIKYL